MEHRFSSGVDFLEACEDCGQIRYKMIEIPPCPGPVEYQVLGHSGVMYPSIPKEVWDHVPSESKRMVKR